MDSSGRETSFTRDMALPIVDCLMLTMLALALDGSHVTAYLRQAVGDDFDELIDPFHHQFGTAFGFQVVG